MTTNVYIKNYEEPPIDIKEALRYAGARSDESPASKLLFDCIEEAREKLVYKVCYARFPIKASEGKVDFGFCEVKSSSLAKLLSTSTHAVIFAATVGVMLDRLIARYSSVFPTRAFLLDALGTERVESLADIFCEELSEEYSHVTTRFSAGYGDLPIEFQREIFSILDCPRKIGLTLNESLIMSPRKSVTAIVGIVDKTDI